MQDGYIFSESFLDHFHGKTMVIVAHRLSTIKMADQILVLNNGKIKEFGNHNQLIQLKGDYFELIKKPNLLNYV